MVRSVLQQITAVDLEIDCLYELAEVLRSAQLPTLLYTKLDHRDALRVRLGAMAIRSNQEAAGVLALIDDLPESDLALVRRVIDYLRIEPVSKSETLKA